MSRYIDIAVKPMQQYVESDIKPGGLLVTNPPYGERITSDDLMGLYSMIGTQLKHVFKGFDAWVLSYRDECFDHIGLKAADRVPMMNGALECEFRKYEIFDGKYNDFKRETGGFKRNHAEKEETRDKKYPERKFDSRRDTKPQRRYSFDDRKRPEQEDRFRKDDREDKPSTLYRGKREEKPFGKRSGDFRINSKEKGARSAQFGKRWDEKETYEKKFAAEYDYDDEIKISRFRRNRPHGDEAIRSYVIGRKPSIGNPDEKKETQKSSDRRSPRKKK